MSLAGLASLNGTERFRQRFASGADPGHFRRFQDVWASSIGLGTYLGDADDETDARYAGAVAAACRLGGNLFDAAINYRCQRSERAIGRAVAKLTAEGAATRDELILCTKGGYVPFDGEVPDDPGRYVADRIINAGLASYDELVGGCHCLAPGYLDAMLSMSLANLRVSTVDVYYLHNPEEQLREVSRDTFMARMAAAFELLERRAAEGAIRYYGLATWNGLRRNPQAQDYLPLETLAQLAERTGGAQHHFRAIQLPYNLAMPEAASFANQPVGGTAVPVLEAARQLGLSVAISASLLQGRLADLPSRMSEHIPGLATSAQRAVQFVRSTPGVTTALVGMKQAAHVEEIFALAAQPLLTAQQVAGLFDRSRR
jgi:aryl-alcohol dehydrogenase-like predicted oxidoreductase